MIKKLIVGSGFSASIVNIILGNKAKIFGINDLNKIRPNGFIRRKNLDCNKVFCKKSLSIGSIRFHLKVYIVIICHSFELYQHINKACLLQIFFFYYYLKIIYL